MHIALPIGDTNVLMANDVPGIPGTVNEQKNRSGPYASTATLAYLFLYSTGVRPVTFLNVSRNDLLSV